MSLKVKCWQEKIDIGLGYVWERHLLVQERPGYTIV